MASMKSMKSWGIVLAAGREQELANGVDVAMLSLGTRPVLGHILLAFEECVEIDEVAVVVPAARLAVVRSLCGQFNCRKVTQIVAGGETRRAGLAAGLAAARDGDVVTIHDAHRPCLRREWITSCVLAARKFGAGILAAPVEDLPLVAGSQPQVKEVYAGGADLWLAQSPRSYRVDLLDRALRKARSSPVFDEATDIHKAGGKIRLIDPGRLNPRVRTPDDLVVASALIG